jgi:hypothetical protein
MAVVMQHNTLSLLFILFITGGCASHTGRTLDDRPSGAEQARRDIAAGRLELRAYGLVAPEDGDFAQLLQEHFGVRFTRVAGCAISGEEAKRVDAYNRIMTGEIERRFGRGSIERQREDAVIRGAMRRLSHLHSSPAPVLQVPRPPPRDSAYWLLLRPAQDLVDDRPRTGR